MRIPKIVLVTWCIVVVSGCAAPRDMAAPAAVDVRAQERWDALVRGDYATAYGYFSEGYRQAVSLESFDTRMRNRTVDWQRAEVESFECPREDVCEVRVNVFYSVQQTARGLGAFESVRAVTERWVRAGNSWYFVPDRI